MRPLIIYFIFLPFIGLTQNYNMELMSHVRFADDCADVWGYADTNGREYAFVGRVTGTSVFDVTDPKKPVELQFIPGVVNLWREIKTYKNRAYVVADKGADGVLIINMSQAPAKITWSFWHPTLKVDDKTLGISKTVSLDRAHDLLIDENGICFLHGSNVHQGLVMLDLNKNPDVPEYIGIFNPNYSHGGFVRRDTFWSADIIAGEFTVWDLKDKTKPKKIANQRTGNAFTHSIALSDDGAFAYTTDERANAYLEGYKVDNLSNITLTDRYRSRTTQIRNTIPHNIFNFNKFIIAAYYTDGFTVVDASDPNHLVEVGAYDTYPAGDGDFHGCWGVYPYLPSGNILASDIEFGLYIVKPTYKHASYLQGLVKDLISGIAIPDALIQWDIIPFNAVKSLNNGSFKTGGAYEGATSLTISKAGYEVKHLTLNLNTGLIIDTTVLLKPLKAFTLKTLVIDAISKQPLKNTNILLIRPEETISFTTGDNGSATVVAHEGTWQLYAGDWGHQYKKLDVLDIAGTQDLTIELQKGYEDNFLFNYGWTAQSTAVAGIWGRTEPLGTYIEDKAINPEYDLPDDYGDQCMITGNGTTAVTAGDVDGGYTRLISPAINLTSISKPFIHFAAWTARLNIFDTIPAGGSFKIFITSGSDTLLIDTLPGNLSAWTFYHFPIDKSTLKNQSNVSIIFEASEPVNIDARNAVEFGIDGFSITDGATTAVQTAENAISFKVFPTLMYDRLTIQSEPDALDRKIELIDQMGRKVYETTFCKNQASMTIQKDLISGIYFVKMTAKNGASDVKKVLKM